ncbi:MAG: BatD family protein [Bacteroidota bacterium]
MKRKALNFSIVCAFLMGLSVFGKAQGIVAVMKVDTNVVVVGQPFTLELSITQPKDAKLDWPFISDSIGLLEVIKNNGVDTIPVEDKSILMRSQKVTMMAFDTGQFIIPGYTIDYKLRNSNAKVYTDPLAIKVYTLTVDTTKAIKDIHPIQDVPYDWMMIAMIIAGVILLAFIVWLIARYLKNAKKKDDANAILNVLKHSPYEVAMMAFEQLKSNQFWQNGEVKKYYSELTEIVRMYIQNRWMIPALEYTSDEILEHAFIKQLNANEHEKLVYLLRLADLVKFAKAIPHVAEHELSLSHALQFVVETTPASEKEIPQEKGGEL